MPRFLAFVILAVVLASCAEPESLSEAGEVYAAVLSHYRSRVSEKDRVGVVARAFTPFYQLIRKPEELDAAHSTDSLPEGIRAAVAADRKLRLITLPHDSLPLFCTPSRDRIAGAREDVCVPRDYDVVFSLSLPAIRGEGALMIVQTERFKRTSAPRMAHEIFTVRCELVRQDGKWIVVKDRLLFIT